MIFFSDILAALHKKSFYKQTVTYPLSRGFIHLFKLALIATFFLVINLIFQVNPKANDFIDWLEKEMPELTLTPDRLIMNAKSPFVFKHPVYGDVARIDTTQELATPEEIADYFVYATAKRLYINSGSNVRSIDLTRNPGDVKPEDYVERWDGQFIRDTYQKMRPWALVFMLFVFFLFFFVIKMAEVFLFSFVGVLINLKRKEKLGYASIYIMGCFAITLSSFLQVRGFLFAPLTAIPFGFLGSFLVTSGYYFLALKEENIISAD